MSKIHQERIDTQKNMIKNRHDNMRDKITKNLQAMDKAAKSAMLAKILGWAGAAWGLFALTLCVIVEYALSWAWARLHY